MSFFGTGCISYYNTVIFLNLYIKTVRLLGLISLQTIQVLLQTTIFFKFYIDLIKQTTFININDTFLS